MDAYVSRVEVLPGCHTCRACSTCVYGHAWATDRKPNHDGVGHVGWQPQNRTAFMHHAFERVLFLMLSTKGSSMEMHSTVFFPSVPVEQFDNMRLG